MNLLVTAILLLSLFWSEIRTPVEAESAPWIIAQVFLISLLSPAFAAFQMWIGRKGYRKELPGHWISKFRSMVIAHSAVWAVVSLVIIYAMQWPDAVRLIPNASTIPLLDDVLLIMPSLLSLVSSWAIFVYGAPKGTLSASKSKTAIYSLWLRMQVLMVLVPILFAFCVTDCLRLAVQIQFSTAGIVSLCFAGGCLLVATAVFYPQIMMLVLKTKPLEDEDLRARFKKLFNESSLRPRQLHVWQTGNSVANAAAIGIVSGTEVIVLSDFLLKKFNDDELDAIVLHEIGHIKRRHCIKRIAMVLLPLFFLAADQSTNWGLHATLAQSAFLHSTFGALAEFLPAIGFLVYLLIASKLLFRNMEFEADEFAIETSHRIGAGDSTELALEKLAVIYPRQVDRRSGLHPSIRERLAFATERRAQILSRQRIDSAEAAPPLPSISLDPATAK